MHIPEYGIINVTHEILWNFEIQADHSIPARKQDLVLLNKKKELYVEKFLLFQWIIK